MGRQNLLPPPAANSVPARRRSTMMFSAEDFRKELKAQLERAHLRGASHIEINAGELHRTLGGYPGIDHRIPICCSVMHQEVQEGDEIVFGPDQGKGASLTIRYRIPRTAKVVPLRRS